MKKIIISSLAFVAIALLPQTVSAQAEATPTKPVVKEQKVMKEATPAKEQKVLFHKRKNVVPAKKAQSQKTVDVKNPKVSQKDPNAVKGEKAPTSDKPVEMVVKPLKGSNKKIAKPTKPQTKNLKQ